MSDLEHRISKAKAQAARAIARVDIDEAEWCQLAIRVYRERLEVAKKQGYWEHEYEPLEEALQ